MQHSDLEITSVVSRPFDENSYIVRLPDSQDCFVVDPGFEPDKIIAEVENQELTPVAILITHGHSDHIAGNGALKERWPECPLVIGQADAEKLTDPEKNLSAPFGLSLISPQADKTLVEGDTYSVAGLDLEVLEIPGHSSGHIVYIWKGALPFVVFGGDVLFAGSIGRTDFPDGSFEQLEDGIHKKLFALPDETIVLPGHGPATTIGTEKKSNPFVGRPAGWTDA